MTVYQQLSWWHPASHQAPLYLSCLVAHEHIGHSSRPLALLWLLLMRLS